MENVFFTDELKNKIMNHFKKFDISCTFCGNKYIRIQNGIKTIQISDSAIPSDNDKRSFIPTVVLVCKECGYTHDFAIKVMEEGDD